MICLIYVLVGISTATKYFLARLTTYDRDMHKPWVLTWILLCICTCQVTLSAARPEVDKRRERLGLSVEEIIEFNARDDGSDEDTEAGSEAVGTAATTSPQAKRLSALNSKTEVDAYVVATPAALLPW